MLLTMDTLALRLGGGTPIATSTLYEWFRFDAEVERVAKRSRAETGFLATHLTSSDGRG